MAERVGMDGIWELASVLESDGDRPSGAVSAQVTRVDSDGSVWVHIPGGADETPVNGYKSASVKPGDSVSVALAGGSVDLVGNNSDPSVGGTYVQEALAPVSVLASSAAESSEAASKLAEEAKAVAEATSQYFWSDENGAHVSTEALNPVGASNSLWNSLGLLIRKAANNLVSITQSAISFYDGLGNLGANIVARFGSDGAQIGQTDSSHIQMDYRSLQLVDNEGQTYLFASDLRDSSGVAGIVETFVCDGSTKDYYLSFTATDTSYSVLVSDGSGGANSKTTAKVVFATAPTAGAVVTVSYDTSSILAKAYTFGFRGSGNIGGLSHAEGRSVVASGTASHAEGHSSKANGYASHAEGMQTVASGGLSHSEGFDTVASGQDSHAEGYGSTASGYASHAEGYGSTASGLYSHAHNWHTIAAGNQQTAIGKFNASDTTSALIVGNGTSNTARSNALALDWSGNLVTSGNITDGGGNVLANKANTSSLATVATSGNYADLSGAPNLATVATSGAYSDLSGAPNLATVATSGDYSDLSNKPTIPTATSQLTNDSGFIDATAIANKMDADAPLFHTEIASATVPSTSGGSNASGSTTVPTVSGYTPVGISDWWWHSGSRQNYFLDYGTHLEGSTLYYRFRNTYSGAAYGELWARILYVKTDNVTMNE